LGFFLAGIPGAMESLNSIEGSLEDVLTSVANSDNNVVVPDSTSSNMVVIEMASFAPPAA
jgi:pilus assembly protein TadC